MRSIWTGTAALAGVVSALSIIGTAASAPAGAGTAPALPPVHDQVIVFVPHADDDVLSMGVFIHREVQLGHDVRAVYYTDGAGTGVCSVDVHGICEADNQFHGLPVEQFIADRDSEFQHSMAALGVPADHVDYGTDGYRFRDGRSTVADATWMLQQYHAAYPNATLVTMSWIDGHPDHASAGKALRALVENGTIPADEAIFSLGRWYWAYDYPQRTSGLTQLSETLRAAMGYPLATELMRCDDGADATCGSAIHNAVESYHSVSDGGDGYGIGYASVPVYLDVVDQDPEVLLHGVAAGKYPARAAFRTAQRGSGQTVTTTLTGSVALPDYGRYATDADDQASAPYLAQTLIGSLVSWPLPAGTQVTVSALDSSGRVLERGLATLYGTAFRIVMPVPAGTVRVTANVPGSAGVAPSTVTWPVQTQRATLQPRTGLRIYGSTVTGSYGRPFAVEVRSSLGSTAVPGAWATLTAAQMWSRPPQTRSGRTGSTGTVTLTAVLDRTASWRVTTTASAGVVPAARGFVHTKVTAARVVLRVAQASVPAHRTTTLIGVLAGRDYRIPAAYLRPARINVWLAVPGRRRILLAGTTSGAGGQFSVNVHPRRRGALICEVLGVSGVYEGNSTAAEIAVG